MTLEEFRATRVYLRSMNRLFDWPGDDIPGFVYCGLFFIDEAEDGSYFVELHGFSKRGDLELCEMCLFTWLIGLRLEELMDTGLHLKALALSAEQCGEVTT